jgi:UDP-glucose 4-epimerase
MYLSLYQRIYGIKPLVVRPANPYGPRQGHYMAHGVISTFLRRILKNEELVVYGDGSAVKDFIYIEDLIDICYKLFEHEETGVFNVGSGSGVSINEIVQKIKLITGTDSMIKYNTKQIFDVDRFVLSQVKLNNLFGGYQYTNLETGISKTWSWIKSSEESL